MAFPLTITGHVTVRACEQTSTRSVVEHLRTALSTQAVDLISVVDDAIRFTPQAAGNEGAFRPDGVSWLFRLIGSSLLVVDRRTAVMDVSYRLNCRLWFYTTTLFSGLAGIAMALTTSIGTHWAAFCTFGSWTMLFASGYLGTKIDFHHWLGTSLESFGVSSAERSCFPSDTG